MSAVPRSLFAADGTMLHCSAKSKLMDILGKRYSAETSDVAPPDIPQQTNVLRYLILWLMFSQGTNLASL